MKVVCLRRAVRRSIADSPRMVSVSSRPTITSSQASRPRCSVPLRYRLDSLGFYAVFRMIISLCIGTRVGFSLDWSEARERERRRLVLMVGAHSDQLRNNVTLGQFRVDVDIAHMSAFDGELAAAIQEAPREFLPAVRTRERASDSLASDLTQDAARTSCWSRMSRDGSHCESRRAWTLCWRCGR